MEKSKTRKKGHEKLSCDVTRDGVAHAVPPGQGGLPCLFSFIFIYFFGMAASLWWVCLCFTWFLAAALKWSKEAISKVHFFKPLPKLKTKKLRKHQIYTWYHGAYQHLKPYWHYQWAMLKGIIFPVFAISVSTVRLVSFFVLPKFTKNFTFVKLENFPKFMIFNRRF